MKKAIALLKQWVRDPIINYRSWQTLQPRQTRKILTTVLTTVKRDTIDQYVMFRRIFNKNLQDGEIIL